MTWSSSLLDTSPGKRPGPGEDAPPAKPGAGNPVSPRAGTSPDARPEQMPTPSIPAAPASASGTPAQAPNWPAHPHAMPPQHGVQPQARNTGTRLPPGPASTDGRAGLAEQLGVDRGPPPAPASSMPGPTRTRLNKR
jgi:hypothetical protein